VKKNEREVRVLWDLEEKNKKKKRLHGKALMRLQMDSLYVHHHFSKYRLTIAQGHREILFTIARESHIMVYIYDTHTHTHAHMYTYVYIRITDCV